LENLQPFDSRLNARSHLLLEHIFQSFGDVSNFFELNGTNDAVAVCPLFWISSLRIFASTQLEVRIKLYLTRNGNLCTILNKSTDGMVFVDAFVKFNGVLRQVSAGSAIYFVIQVLVLAAQDVHITEWRSSDKFQGSFLLECKIMNPG
jgi:hypothetical protein